MLSVSMEYGVPLTLLVAIGLSGCGNSGSAKARKLIKNAKSIAARGNAKRQAKWEEMVQGGSDVLELLPFPNQKKKLEVGQTVFSPNPTALQKARSENDQSRSLSYGSYEVVTIGEKLATVKPRGFTNPTEDDVHAIPHGWLIPAPAKAQVSPGDLLIGTWSQWQMSHMVVTEASSPPKASIQLGPKQVELDSGSYLQLTEPWQPGSWIAYYQAPRIDRAMIIATTDDKVLVHNLEGPKIMERSSVIAIPPKPTVKAGDRIWGYWSSNSFRAGSLESIDQLAGEFVVKLDTLKGDGEIARIPFGCLTGGDLSRLKP